MKFSKLPLSSSIAFVLASSFGSHALAESKLEETTIIASKIPVPIREVGASVTVINQDTIELSGYTSVEELLRTQLSISATNSGGAGTATSVRIRGEEGYRTLVLIDGIETSDPSGTQVGPQIQHLRTASGIGRIEVLRGPQGFIYGADAGGVINILTKESEEAFEAKVGIESGKYNSGNFDAYIAGSNDAVNYFVSGSKQKTDGFNSRSADFSEDADGYENVSLHAKLGVNITDSISFTLVARDVDAQTEFDSCGRFDEDFNFLFTNNCDGDFQQSNLKGTFNFENETTSQTASYAYTDVERESFADGTSTFQIDGEIDKYEYLGSYTLSEEFTLVTGADKKTETIVSSGTESDRDQLGIFSELQSKLGNFFFSIGARYDDNDDFGEHISARASAAYIVPMGNNELKFRSSVGNGFRAPSLSEIAYNNTNAFGAAAEIELQEEKSRGYDLGVEFYTAAGASYKLGIFKQDIDNEIFFDLVQFSGYLQADEGGLSRGVELEIEQPASKYLTILFNATYNDTETTGGLQRIRRPEIFGNLGLESHLFDGKLDVLANLRISRNAENEAFGIGRLPLEDYEVVDLSARYTINENLSVFGRVQNLFDDEYEEIGGFNASRRAAYVGVDFSF